MNININFKNTKTQYGAVARVLHWVSVSLLLTLIVLASQFEDMLAGSEKLKLTVLHSSLGLIFLLVMLTRLTWRKANENPIKSYKISRWQKITAISLHRTIYIVLITQCIVGVVSLIARGDPIHIFSLFELPAFAEQNTRLHHFSVNVHHFISIMIYPLLAIHISAAIYHQIFGLVEE